MKCAMLMAGFGATVPSLGLVDTVRDTCRHFVRGYVWNGGSKGVNRQNYSVGLEMPGTKAVD
jgi:hypothetical protein